MNMMLRQFALFILVALVVLFLLLFSCFTLFPLGDWSILWKTKIMNLPFIVFAPTVVILIGAAFGIVSNLWWRQQLQTIANALQQIEQGSLMQLEVKQPTEDFQEIWERLQKIHHQWIEQTKRSQKMATAKAEQQERLIQDIISQERNRLARELHDSVSQQLFAASMMMSAIMEEKERSDNHETKQLKLIEQMIHQSQLEMRALLLHLRPVQLKGKSLQEGMEELLLELSQKTPMQIKWKIEDAPLDKGVEDHLFRILQESVSNTLRHAKASTLEVLLIQRDHFAILRVVDDGIGFDVHANHSKSGSYGLQNMYERAAEIGGTLKIISLKNKGTRLEVKVPIVAQEDQRHD
ncbi:histidine kinase family protein [Anoxybacillus sp. B7M1]|jgi:two-component system, NarL family, sensor histidine kinase LiaS|uniref:Sensor histidine kinase n=1 Tax=Anoxybacteroides rupiense TaxID=311460 RepID=A0ABT5W9Q4_9BACL|nr:MULTISPECIES: sensor histidine kinase [Anoxybacillus]ANB55566.1 histidine kinase family protein [Anoxybacillus sp. B2M1]ANB63798.1 histidine kinase family protein [Anoxybacillus sp. B7M1]MBB3908686.1 NarL family two-component system sensor histidine kinase LiaS [Anoxybacillus rupiensis]MBS2770326.1 sensor histidine kinase [Anoxybacillus rupiensis]MDE8564836.1 sensor histidine kinase [Anoxybacillus rupiensis]